MKAKRRSNSELVYSTSGGGGGRKKCDSLKENNWRPASSTPKDGVVRVGREVKGRKGKTVTTVTGAPLTTNAELESLSKELKGLCAAGGTLRGDVIEIQGEHRDHIVEALRKKGWTVKRAGG